MAQPQMDAPALNEEELNEIYNWVRYDYITGRSIRYPSLALRSISLVISLTEC